MLVEVLDELDQRAVVERPLADLAVEVDALENVLEGVGVGVLDGGERLVQPGADRRLQVGDAEVAALVVGVAPAGLVRHEEVVLVRVGELLLDQVGLQPLLGRIRPGVVPGPRGTGR